VELSQIRYFVALCEELKFTRAAKRCGVSQPSLSNGIRVLERKLGGELFERPSMALTPLGKRVRPHLANVVASIERVEKTAGAFRRRALARNSADAVTTSKTPAPISTFGQWFEELQRGAAR
jgi:DNA-binding transcriptional LysR family regulator